MRVCVFTAIFSEREPIDKPAPFAKIAGWDYVMFTNLPASVYPADCSWEIRQVPVPWDVLPDGSRVAGAKMIYANRYYKWKPQQHLSEYDVVIYVDGFQAPDARKESVWRELVEELMANAASYSLIQCPHPKNTCIYTELAEIVSARKDTRESMMGVFNFLKSEGYPEGRGLFWNGCYVLNNKCPLIKKVWGSLWSDMLRLTYRDQSLMMYELWKHDMVGRVKVWYLENIVMKVFSNWQHVYT